MSDGMERKRASKGLLLFGSLSLGALAMYLADPQMGRTRRSHLRQRYQSAARKVQESRDAVVHDASARAAGAMASIRAWLRSRGKPVPDTVLADRTRAALDRATSHSRAIDVHADQGEVTLSGEALQAEGRRILATVRRVRGVRSIKDRIIAYETAEGVSSLQGAEDVEGRRIEPASGNWSPAWRSLAGAIGAGLTLAGWIRGGARGLALGAVGGGLVAQAATHRDVRNFARGRARRHGVVIRKTIHVDRPVDVVFGEWRFERFPEWMSHVRFRSEGTGTRVEVTLCYIPVAGMAGHAVARALGRDPASAMDDGLARFKSLVENRA